MTTILLATDFSENAKSAVQYAIDLFEYTDARFILLNTYENPRTGAGNLKSITNILRDDSKRRLKRERQRLLDYFNKAELEIEMLAAYGSIVGIINELINREHIDIVAIGAKGMTALERVVAGSNSINIINKVRVPILIIPKEVRYKRPEIVAFALDNVRLKNPKLLNVLTSLVKHYDAEIKGITVETEDAIIAEPSPEELQLDEAFKDIKHSFEHKKYDNVVSGIDHYIHEENADILVVVARKYNFFERLFHKSISKTLSILADIPMVILPDVK